MTRIYLKIFVCFLFLNDLYLNILQLNYANLHEKEV